MTATFNTAGLEPLAGVESHPGINWSSVYPRHYHNAPGYLAARYLARFLGSMTSSQVRDAASKAKAAGDEAAWVELATLMNATTSVIAGGVQQFWLGRDIGEALMCTRPPETETVRTVPWPFPAFVLYLPKGLFPTEVSGDIAAVWVANIANYAWVSPDGGTERGPALNLCALSITDDGTTTNWYASIPATTSLKRDVAELPYQLRAEMPQGKDDREVVPKLLDLIVNLCYYMAQAPEAVEPDTIGGKKKKGKEARAWWTPRWVGRSYKLPSVDHGGTHNSPRMHWRRGHFRGQHYGEGRQQLRQIWIQPVLVNADTPETASVVSPT